MAQTTSPTCATLTLAPDGRPRDYLVDRLGREQVRLIDRLTYRRLNVPRSLFDAQRAQARHG